MLQADIEHNVYYAREILDRHARHLDIRVSEILQNETKPLQMDAFLGSTMISKYMLTFCHQTYLSA